MAKKHKQTDDYGYKKTDEQLNELEDRLSSLYAEASHDMEKKLGDFLSGYEERDKQKRELLEAGKITEEEYQRWRVGQIFQTKKMQAQIDSLTQDLVNTDKLAMQMVNGELPSIYATNYNFQGFKAETVTDLEGVDMASFSIYNADAVARLAKKNPDLLPAPKVDIPKDMKWNKTKINTAISQGIIQGEPINKIAARLQQVTDMDYNAAIRNARTAVVGAQNAGRKDASERITKNGVPMIDVWSSTYDGRTRDTHIALNGQERDEDGYFHTFNGDKLEYPCDPKANPAEVYNCRCRLNSFIKGIDHSLDDKKYEDMMREQDYESWMEIKKKQDEKRELYDKNKAAVEEKLEKKESAVPDVKNLLPAEAIEQPDEKVEEIRPAETKDIMADAKVWADKISKSEKDAIHDYTDGGYAKMNDILRGKLSEEREKAALKKDPELYDKMFNIEQAINKFELSEGIKVYRIADSDSFNIPKVGDTFHDKGFVSTTTERSVLDDMQGDVIFEIDVSAGKGIGAYIDEFSEYGREQEFLMQRDSEFEVISIKEENGIKIVKMQYKGVKWSDNEDEE